VAELSTKPYFVRAIHQWCCDSGLTPYLSVKVDGNTRVPKEYVKDGEIVLNISTGATRNLTIDNNGVQFSARFNGVSREISVPLDAVIGIFARENGQGMGFPPVTVGEAGKMAEVTTPARDDAPGSTPKPPGAGGKSHLKVVK
jgi:stringent starvation protein B